MQNSSHRQWLCGIPRCIKCDGGVECIKCAKFYNLSDNVCLLESKDLSDTSCSAGCELCNSTQCLVCIKGYDFDVKLINCTKSGYRMSKSMKIILSVSFSLFFLMIFNTLLVFFILRKRKKFKELKPKPPTGMVNKVKKKRLSKDASIISRKGLNSTNSNCFNISFNLNNVSSQEMFNREEKDKCVECNNPVVYFKLHCGCFLCYLHYNEFIKHQHKNKFKLCPVHKTIISGDTGAPTKSIHFSKRHSKIDPNKKYKEDTNLSVNV